MKLFANMLIEWQDNTDNIRIDRVLWMDPSGVDVVTIDVVAPKALPVWQKRVDIETALATEAARILQADPCAKLFRPEDTIPESHRQRRDDNWAIIAPLVSSEEIFVPKKRGPLVSVAVHRSGRSKRSIYTYLRRYWQGGQTKNALLPHYDRCGGKGKERRCSERKRGRPSALARATGRTTGVNTTPEIQERLRRGIRLFYEDNQGRPLTKAYQLTLEKFFHKGYEQRGDVWVPILPPADELPTLDQFRYWYEKDRDPTRAITAREGKRRFETRHRAVLGDSTQMAFGPGSLYQIDATIGDIYLVSSLDPNRIIGRPVLYAIIDVFSRLITGIGVSLEGPSWLSAMLALENTTSDKVAFCAEYGISISEDEWPSHHLPEAILADRGELEGYDADNLVNALSIQVSNTAPYRADWKGIVERSFRLSNDKMIRWLPGAVYRPRERGGTDYRLDACLNLDQFRRLMILCVLHHNSHHRMDWYRLDEFMIQDHVEPYPIDLWNWGIRNRVGHLRAMDQEIVRLNFLPKGEASVTRNGIRFQGLHYSCRLALEKQWFVRARERGSWRIPVAYDPRKLDAIYLRLDEGRRMEVCHLHDRDRTFRGRDWQDTLDYLALQKQAAASARTRQQQADAELHARIEQIVSQAMEQTEQAGDGESNHARLGGIRRNRQQERELERRNGAWLLTAEEAAIQSEKAEGAAQIKQSGEADHGYVPPPRPIDTLRKLRQEKLNHER